MQRSLIKIVGVVSVALVLSPTQGFTIGAGTVGNRDLSVDRAFNRAGRSLPATAGNFITGADVLGGGGAGGGNPQLDPTLDTHSANLNSLPDLNPDHLALHQQLLAALNAFVGGQLTDRILQEDALSGDHDAYHADYAARAAKQLAEWQDAMNAMHAKQAGLNADHATLHDDELDPLIKEHDTLHAALEQALADEAAFDHEMYNALLAEHEAFHATYDTLVTDLKAMQKNAEKKNKSLTEAQEALLHAVLDSNAENDTVIEDLHTKIDDNKKNLSKAEKDLLQSYIDVYQALQDDAHTDLHAELDPLIDEHTALHDALTTATNNETAFDHVAWEAMIDEHTVLHDALTTATANEMAFNHAALDAKAAEHTTFHGDYDTLPGRTAALQTDAESGRKKKSDPLVSPLTAEQEALFHAVLTANGVDITKGTGKTLHEDTHDDLKLGKKEKDLLTDSIAAYQAQQDDAHADLHAELDPLTDEHAALHTALDDATTDETAFDHATLDALTVKHTALHDALTTATDNEAAFNHENLDTLTTQHTTFHGAYDTLADDLATMQKAAESKKEELTEAQHTLLHALLDANAENDSVISDLHALIDADSKDLSKAEKDLFQSFIDAYQATQDAAHDALHDDLDPMTADHDALHAAITTATTNEEAFDHKTLTTLTDAESVLHDDIAAADAGHDALHDTQSADATTFHADETAAHETFHDVQTADATAFQTDQQTALDTEVSALAAQEDAFHTLPSSPPLPAADPLTADPVLEPATPPLESLEPIAAPSDGGEPK